MNQAERLCVITGSTSGIGKVTSMALARQKMRLILPVRNVDKAERLKEEIFEETGNQRVDIYECDLSSLESIKEFALAFNDRYQYLNILINNAGLWETDYRESADGVELTFAVNHLAPFYLTHLLMDRLNVGQPSRIINVASMAHMGAQMQFGHLFEKASWGSFRSYARSKLANILFTRKLSEKLEGSQITVNSLHPGIVNTGLYKKMPDFFAKLIQPLFISPEKGAQTLIYLALSPEVEKISGGYFVNRKKKKPAPQARSSANADKLWEVSLHLINSFEKIDAYAKT